MGFYEVIETERFFDETFVEDFVRVSDVVASWEIREKKHREEVSFPKLVSTTLFFCFRYYLNTEDSKFILRKIEKCFLIAEFYRLIHSNRVFLNVDAFNQAIAMLLKMRYLQINTDNMANLISETNFCLKLYGGVSNIASKCNYKQVLTQLKVFEFDKPFILKNNLLQMMKNLSCYRSQFFQIKMSLQTIKQQKMEFKMMLMINSNGIAFSNERKVVIYGCNFDHVRTVLIKNNNIQIVLNAEDKDDSEIEVLPQPNEVSEFYENEQSKDSEKFVKYVRICFTANQASLIYITIQNYISLQLNGMYRASKINTARFHVDVDELKIEKNDLKFLESEAVPLGNANRFNK